jgi:hypothetical protein
LEASPSSPGAPPSPAPRRFAVDSVVRTVVDGLRVRPAPGTAPLTGDWDTTLTKGRNLFVAAGPEVASGYTWLYLMNFEMGPSGWVAAASTSGSPWLEASSLPCPSLPLTGTAALSVRGMAGIVCFGRREITIVGDVACELGEVERFLVGPAWIRADRHCELDLSGESMELMDAGIGGLQRPARGRATITGHFDDPAAEQCRWAGDPPARDPISVLTGCRSMFVATEFDF